MGWANIANVTTDHLDASSDDPSQARSELYSALVELQAVIQGRDTANGVCGLDGSGLVPAARLPDTVSSSAGQPLTLQPDSGRVSIDTILNLTSQTVTELAALTGQVGDVSYCSNGDAGSPCLAVYDGSNWLRIALGSAVSAT